MWQGPPWDSSVCKRGAGRPTPSEVGSDIPVDELSLGLKRPHEARCANLSSVMTGALLHPTPQAAQVSGPCATFRQTAAERRARASPAPTPLQAPVLQQASEAAGAGRGDNSLCPSSERAEPASGPARGLGRHWAQDS